MLEVDRFLRSANPERVFRDRFHSPTCSSLESRYGWVARNGQINRINGFVMHKQDMLARPDWGTIIFPKVVTGGDVFTITSQRFIIKNPNLLSLLGTLGVRSGIYAYNGILFAGQIEDVDAKTNYLTIMRPIKKEKQQELLRWYNQVLAYSNNSNENTTD